MNRFLKILGQFYPLPLLLLVFFPMLIALFIDHELVEARFVIINLLWLGFFTIPAAILKSKILYRLTVILLALFGFIELGHWLILEGPVTLTSILVSSNTNFQEAVDFFDLKASLKLILLLPYAVLAIYAFIKTPSYSNQRYRLLLSAVLILASAIFMYDGLANERFIRKSTPQLLKVSLSFIEQKKLYDELNVDVSPENVAVQLTMDSEEQTFVLIIGESLNRNHMSLYGAERKTTPKLDKRKDLLVFNDVVSPYSNTISSVLSIMSESNLENDLDFHSSIDLLDIFSSAGFKTYWLSNQSPLGIWENTITIFAKQAAHVQFTNITSSSSKEAALTTSHDSKLFNPFYHALKEDVDKKFIVLHLMGSHSSYSKRYPSKFDVFSGSDSKEKVRAEYDNSVYYNDFIIDSLFHLLANHSIRNPSEVNAAIYLSDHSENVYDEFDKVGHDFANELPKSNVEVPFMLWLSQSYMDKNTDKLNEIRPNLNKPFVSDDLFHSVLDLNKIQSDSYIEKRSIFNSNYNDARERVLEDGMDYDLK